MDQLKIVEIVEKTLHLFYPIALTVVLMSVQVLSKSRPLLCITSSSGTEVSQW